MSCPVALLLAQQAVPASACIRPDGSPTGAAMPLGRWLWKEATGPDRPVNPSSRNWLADEVMEPGLRDDQRELCCWRITDTTAASFPGWRTSSWDRMWQCQTDVPAMVYLPSQTVMASLGSEDVLGSGFPRARGLERPDRRGHQVTGGMPLTHVPEPDEAQLDQVHVDRMGIRAVVAHRPRLGRAELRSLGGRGGRRPKLNSVAELRDTWRAFAGLHGTQAGGDQARRWR